jgi:hypothetical protein
MTENPKLPGYQAGQHRNCVAIAEVHRQTT